MIFTDNHSEHLHNIPFIHLYWLLKVQLSANIFCLRGWDGFSGCREDFLGIGISSLLHTRFYLGFR